MKKQFKTRKQFLALGILNVDSRYQRKLIPSHVKKIARDFDPIYLGLPDVSEREDGTFWVMDGQNRLAACRIFLGDGWEKQHVECLVYAGMNLEDEAAFFNNRNLTKQLTPWAKFKSRLTAGEHIATEIVRIASDAGFVIGESGHALRCVAALEWVYTGVKSHNAADGPNNLKRTLSVLAKSWGVKGPFPNGDVVYGLGMFLERYNGEVEMPRLVARLAAMTAGVYGLLGKARTLRSIEGGEVASAVFEVIRREYNVGLRNKGLKPLHHD